jgi:hypothetical protein
MAEYAFFTDWGVAAPVDQVWEVITRPEQYFAINRILQIRRIRWCRFP